MSFIDHLGGNASFGLTYPVGWTTLGMDTDKTMVRQAYARGETGKLRRDRQVIEEIPVETIEERQVDTRRETGRH